MGSREINVAKLLLISWRYIPENTASLRLKLELTSVWFFHQGLNPFYILGYYTGTIEYFSKCFLFPSDALKGSIKTKSLSYYCSSCPLNQFVFSAMSKIQSLCCQQEPLRSSSDQTWYKSAPSHSYRKSYCTSHLEKILKGFSSSALIIFTFFFF